MLPAVAAQTASNKAMKATQLYKIRGTKINSADPQLPAVRTAYPTEPCLTFFHPPIELASIRPRGRLHLDRRIDFAAICFGTLLHIRVAQVHIRLEHGCDSGWKRPRQ
jgi:hypothetical protein